MREPFWTSRSVDEWRSCDPETSESVRDVGPAAAFAGAAREKLGEKDWLPMPEPVAALKGRVAVGAVDPAGTVTG
jgi:hypothetical protein